MLHRGLASWLCVLVALAAPPSFAEGEGARAAGALQDASAPVHVRRFALVAGANDGGAGRAVLRFAVRDARSFASVLAELGGVSHEDITLLEEPDVTTLLSTLHGFAPRMQAAAEVDRVELVFYYSGHSDEEGLLLGNERLGYRELRALVDELPADVRIVVLDSCSSGALTRLKGGVRRPPFLLDASSKVKGHAFLTSSSEDEAAQESDRVGGSFFTHYLVSGLRGAADASGDGKVTLTEAYHYAFQETLRRTERSAAGPQHASYDIRLVGTGDLVMTDLRTGAADLELSAPLHGRVLVRHADGTLLAEVRKLDGRTRVLSVPPGSYRVHVEGEGGKVRGTSVLVAHGGRAVVTPSDLEDLPVEPTVTRGPVSARLLGPEAPVVLPHDPREVARLRESGHQLFWGGLGTAAFGTCCLIPSVPAVIGTMLWWGAAPFGRDRFSCLLASSGCTTLALLLVSFGLPVAYTGYGRLDEASELAEENAQQRKAAQGMRY